MVNIFDGGDLVVKALKWEGVKYVFALSGEYIQSIMDACLDEGIRLIDVRHEQAAVHMADGWARINRRPGVALVTAGPGVANAVSGMAVASKQGSPVVLIAGRTPFSEFDTGSGQDLDQTGLMRTITKWSATCYEITRIPQYISQAFRYALFPPMGPVFIDFPADILESEIDEESISFIPTVSPAKPLGEQRLIEAAIEVLFQAKKPLAIAGSGVWWAGAEEELREFIETTGIPLLLSQMARGILPEDHPLCFGPFRPGTREADVILVIGARLNRWLSKGLPPLFGTNQKWVQIDINPGEIGRNRPIDIGIVGDAKEVLKQMTQLAKGRVWQTGAWVEECRRHLQERWKRMEEDMLSDKVPIHPLRLCYEISRFLDRDAILCIDGGDIAVFATMAIRVYQPGNWLDMGNMGFLGTGIPFGIAAKLSYPQKQVLVLTGDGSFGFNAMEMDTAVRHNVPIVVVIANDGAWGMIKHRQEIIYGRTIGTELGFKHYERIVEALGGYGEYVEKPQDIRPALERAFASGVPACINVRTDPTAISLATLRTAKRRE